MLIVIKVTVFLIIRRVPKLGLGTSVGELIGVCLWSNVSAQN